MPLLRLQWTEVEKYFLKKSSLLTIHQRVTDSNQSLHLRKEENFQISFVLDTTHSEPTPKDQLSLIFPFQLFHYEQN